MSAIPRTWLRLLELHREVYDWVNGHLDRVRAEGGSAGLLFDMGWRIPSWAPAWPRYERHLRTIPLNERYRALTWARDRANPGDVVIGGRTAS